jgi:hypothetical protein
LGRDVVMGPNRNEARLNNNKRKSIARAFLSKSIMGVVLGVATIGIVDIGTINQAAALPSFARQTGQPCGTCHTDYPGLTPYGRLFKLGGYTAGGGKYRSTLFPSQNDSTNALAAYAKKWGSGLPTKAPSDNSESSQSIPYAPPISMMAIVGFTHTQADQDPTGSPYHGNDNVVVAPVSFFYGGAITDHIGAFAQMTYLNAPFGAQDPADPFTSKLWTWDQVDVRYANTGMIGDMPITFGITANNNPSVQDPWNTTPAWAFPNAYAVSNVAPTPAAGTLIDGGFAAHVGGVGAYAWINNLVYLELSGYRTINPNTQAKLGADPFGAPGLLDGVAPYWRVAVEPHWGNHWLEFGAFGMYARVHPWAFTMDTNGFYTFDMFPQTDRYNDIGFDTQYQYQGDNYWITLRGTYVHETQTLDASFLNSGTNPTNTLNTFRAYASLAYGNDNRFVVTGQYFDTRGTPDPTLYSNLISCTPPNTDCSPNSNGFIAEIAYIPFISSQAPGWPWANVRVGLQYTYYNKFDGDTASAHNNNTLFAYIWFAM